MARKKAEKEVVEEVQDDTKYLSEAEMRLLEDANFKKKQSELEYKLARKEVEIASLRAQVLKSYIADLERTAKDVKEQGIGAVEAYVELTAMLKAKYGLGEKWGYDPFTGEIKE